MGEYAQALLDRKRDLTEQLRQLDERADAGAHATDSVTIDGPDGEWTGPLGAAVELTRAAIHECDQGLEDLGLLPAG